VIRTIFDGVFIGMSYNLTVKTAKQAYNWFYQAFETTDDPRCTAEDIKLKEELEEWLISQGE